MLSKYVQEKQDWDLHLQKVVMAYRTSKHETTHYTPAFMFFGKELRMPIDIMHNLPTDQELTPSKYVMEIRDRFNQVYEMARQNIGESQNTMTIIIT